MKYYTKVITVLSFIFIFSGGLYAQSDNKKPGLKSILEKCNRKRLTLDDTGIRKIHIALNASFSVQPENLDNVFESNELSNSKSLFSSITFHLYWRSDGMKKVQVKGMNIDKMREKYDVNTIVTFNIFKKKLKQTFVSDLLLLPVQLKRSMFSGFEEKGNKTILHTTSEKWGMSKGEIILSSNYEIIEMRHFLKGAGNFHLKLRKGWKDGKYFIKKIHSSFIGSDSNKNMKDNGIEIIHSVVQGSNDNSFEFPLWDQYIYQNKVDKKSYVYALKKDEGVSRNVLKSVKELSFDAMRQTIKLDVESVEINEDVDGSIFEK